MATQSNPLSALYAQMLAKGYTAEQIAALTVDMFLEQGKTPAELGQLAAERDSMTRQQIEDSITDITAELDQTAIDALFEFLLDGKADDDYAVPLSRAMQAAANKDLAKFWRACAALFKSMRKKTPHLEGILNGNR